MTSKALPNFVRLTANAQLLRRDQASGPFLVVAAWMGASNRHIAKHTDEYLKLFPSSNVLVLTSNPNDFVFKSVESLASPLRPLLPDLGSDVRLVAFSNGGVKMVRALSSAYRKPIPVTHMLLDSAPGLPTFWSAYAAFAHGFPKSPIVYYPLCLLLIIALNVYRFIALFTTNPLVTAYNFLLDPTALTIGKRCYIYSREDRMVEYPAVEANARDAKAKGWDVRLEQFGGAHVSHAVHDKVRYWKVVQEALV